MAITNQEALDAYNRLKIYCMEQNGCDKCLFAMEEDSGADCLMEFQDTPNEWQELDLD